MSVIWFCVTRNHLTIVFISINTASNQGWFCPLKFAWNQAFQKQNLPLEIWIGIPKQPYVGRLFSSLLLFIHLSSDSFEDIYTRLMSLFWTKISIFRFFWSISLVLVALLPLQTHCEVWSGMRPNCILPLNFFLMSFPPCFNSQKLELVTEKELKINGIKHIIFRELSMFLDFIPPMHYAAIESNRELNKSLKVFAWLLLIFGPNMIILFLTGVKP